MNTPTRFALLTLALLTSGLQSVSAASLPRSTPESVGLSADRLSRLDARIESAIHDGRSAGAVVVIARHGKLAYEKSYGEADLASHRPMQTNQYFRLYSMTKPVTAVALLTLFEQGKFQLSDPLSKYIPEFANVQVYAGENADGSPRYVRPQHPITVEDVFRHTAGFVYGIFGDTAVDRAYRTAQIDYGHSDSVAAMTHQIAGMPLVAEPGTRWIYSFAADVQAYLVEYFSGMAFDAYVKKTILDPLGMQDTVFGVPADRAGRFATLYNPNPAGGLVASANGANYERFTAHPFGGAGLSGTPDDYLRFAQMLLNGGSLDGKRILGRKTVEMMAADHLGAISTPWSGYGFGLGVGVLKDPVAYGQLGSPGQFGWSGYATTSVIIDPKEALVAMYFEQVLPEDNALLADWTNLVYQSITD